MQKEEDDKPLTAGDVTISADALQQLRQLQDTSSLAALEEAAKKQQQANGTNGSLPREELERISAKLDKVLHHLADLFPSLLYRHIPVSGCSQCRHGRALLFSRIVFRSSQA